LGDGLEQRAFGGEVGEEELAQPENAAIEPSTADKERIAAGTARETGGFEVEEESLPGRVGPARSEQVQPWPRWKAIGHAYAPMPVAGRARAIDDQESAAARFAPFAAEDFGGVRRT
jgi:hypothetical protein